ncbi:MAG: SatD family protein, partial [Nocardioides sp.]
MVATLIGDVVGSRRAADRDLVHAALTARLEAVNTELAPLAPLRITVGDEFQGAFATLGDALATTLRLRLALAPEIEVRFGVGWGDVRVLQDEPRVEDGAGWWAARAAIEAVETAQARAGSR